jgi:hypothetical protein
MEMKRTILVIISCLLLLGLVLAAAGCTEEIPGPSGGEQIGVWPKGSDPTVAYINNAMSRAVCGLNWTTLEYTGTEDVIIPEEWVTIWQEWEA